MKSLSIVVFILFIHVMHLQNFIHLNWSPGYGSGDVFTFLYSDNARYYKGEIGNGNKIVLRWIRDDQ